MTERQQGKRTEGGTFLFEFDATEDKRKAFPYACRFYLDGNGELEREFFDLDRDWVGRETVRVSGEYGAEPGDVIEECTHASWKNRYRYLYAISPGGEKVPTRGDKTEIRKYLRGKLAAADLAYYDEDREKFTGRRRRELVAERERISEEIERLRGALEQVEAELAAEKVGA